MVAMTDYFDFYTSLGFKVVPLYPKSKVPIGNKWNDSWNLDDAFQIVKDQKQCNLGILLGDIIDVEGDSKDGNEYLDELIGDLPHPVYFSRRSKHHLFLNTDPDLTGWTYSEGSIAIEFRGHRLQSVLPPSIGPDGTQYCWERTLNWKNCLPIPKMPLDLMNFYLKHRKVKVTPYKSRGLKKDHCSTQCCICKKMVFIHRKRLLLEVRAFREYGVKWHCQNCRELELRANVRRIRKELIRSGEAIDLKLLTPKKYKRHQKLHSW